MRTRLIEPSTEQVLRFCAEAPIERVFLEDVARRAQGRFAAVAGAESELTALCHLGSNLVPSGSGCGAFADLAASRLKPGARWRLATDWEHYAGQMRAVLDEHPRFRNEHRGWAPRWSARPITRFEQRGLDAERPVFDLTYRRV